MLFSGEAGHGLEPVGVMGGTHFDGPVLHGAGDDIGDFGIEPAAFVNNALKFLVHFLGQALAHHVQREDILSVDVISGLPRFAGLLTGEASVALKRASSLAKLISILLGPQWTFFAALNKRGLRFGRMAPKRHRLRARPCGYVWRPARPR